MIRIFRRRDPVVNTGYSGLPKPVADFFRTMDSMDPDETLRAVMEARKAEIRKERPPLAKAWKEGAIAGAKAAGATPGRFVIFPNNPYGSES